MTSLSASIIAEYWANNNEGSLGILRGQLADIAERPSRRMRAT
jgi:hypothetical protein